MLPQKLYCSSIISILLTNEQVAIPSVLCLDSANTDGEFSLVYLPQHIQIVSSENIDAHKFDWTESSNNLARNFKIYSGFCQSCIKMSANVQNLNC